MTTTATEIATATAPILAIDLGKHKSVACLYRSAEQRALGVRPPPTQTC